MSGCVPKFINAFEKYHPNICFFTRPCFFVLILIFFVSIRGILHFLKHVPGGDFNSHNHLTNQRRSSGLGLEVGAETRNLKRHSAGWWAFQDVIEMAEIKQFGKEWQNAENPG